MSKETENTVLDSIISILNKNPNELKQKIGFDGEESQSSDHSNFHRLSSGKENPSSDSQRKGSSSSSQERDFVKKEAEAPTMAQSLREKLKKHVAPKEKINKNIFEGKKFTFIPYDLVLTTKRITILTENIQKKGGTVVLYQNFIWNPAKTGDIIIIVTREMPYDLFMSTVPAIFQQEIQHFTFLDVEWITACLRERKLVDQTPYLVRWNEPQPKIESKQRRYTSIKKADEKAEVKNERIVDQVKPKIHGPSKGFQESSIGATFLERDSDDEGAPVKYEHQKGNGKGLSRASTNVPGISRESTNLRFNTDDSGYDSASSEKSLLNASKNTSEEDKNAKMEVENKPTLESLSKSRTDQVEAKTEMDMKKESDIKKEADIKKESGVKEEDSLKRAPVSFLNDDDDEVVYCGRAKKKMKLEEKDLKGTVLEGIRGLDKINIDGDESSAFTEYKIYNPSSQSQGKENEKRESHHQDKEEILICQPQSKTNLNAHLTKELEKLLKAYELLQDKGRMHGYGKAIAILKALPKRVDSVKDVESILGIGNRTKMKIKEILQTGRIREAELIMGQEKMQVLKLFDEVYGIGPTIALQFYSKGLRTIDDLKRNQHLLNDSQKLGLKYYEEFKQKIPRDQVTEISKIVESKVEELSEYRGQFEVICGGSYRRGRAFCSDVDIIMSPKDGKPPTGFLMKLVKSLEGSFLTDHLSLPTPDPSDCETYLGVCYYKGIHRRIDFKISPRERFGPLTIYYTGGNYFNRSIRIVAEKQGYRLDNYGMFPLIRAKDTKHSLQLIPCYTEHDVFKILGLRYIPPEYRDI